MKYSIIQPPPQTERLGYLCSKLALAELDEHVPLRIQFFKPDPVGSIETPGPVRGIYRMSQTEKDSATK